MWPFSAQRDVLRVGREAVQLWRAASSGLVLVDGESLPSGEACSAASLRAGVAALLVRTPAVRAIDGVVESAWLPVLPIEPGPMLLGRAAVEALLRHRVEQVYGTEPGDGWSLMLDHRPGERHGVGYALSAAVRSALLSAAVDAKCEIASLQPALAWARGRLGRQVPATCWFGWMEQDRMLLALLHRGRVQALNAAAAGFRDAAQARRLVEVEAVRQGVIGSAGPLVLGGWGAAPGGSAGLTWLSVAGPELRRPVAVVGTMARERAA